VSTDKHWAKYYLSDSFFAGDQAVELSDRSVDAAVARAPEYAFAFVLYDTAVPAFEFDASLFRVVPIPQNYSAKHYLGGVIYTCDGLRALAVEEGEPGKYRRLISNVTNYSATGDPVEGRAIRCRPGNWQPFEDGDVLVEMRGATV
jgi:hypothetical protein